MFSNYGPESLRYVVAGLINTALGFGVFALFATLLESTVLIVISAYLAHAIVSPIAFLMHRHFVFRNLGRFWPQFAKFQLTYLVPIVLNGPLLYIGIEWWQFNPIAVQGALTLVFIGLTFLLNRVFVFNSRGNPDT